MQTRVINHYPGYIYEFLSCRETYFHSLGFFVFYACREGIYIYIWYSEGLRIFGEIPLIILCRLVAHCPRLFSRRAFEIVGGGIVGCNLHRFCRFTFPFCYHEHFL